MDLIKELVRYYNNSCINEENIFEVILIHKNKNGNADEA